MYGEYIVQSRRERGREREEGGKIEQFTCVYLGFLFALGSAADTSLLVVVAVAGDSKKYIYHKSTSKCLMMR